MYEQLIIRLNSTVSQDRMQAAESIRDLYEDRFQYNQQDPELAGFFVNGLITAIVEEVDEEIQYTMLDALYAWSRFSYHNNANSVLVKHIETLLSIRNIGYALWILIASGSKEYVEQYKQFRYHQNPFIREVAKQGIRSVN